MKKGYEDITQQISNAITQIESNKRRIREIHSDNNQLKQNIVGDILLKSDIVTEILHEIPLGVLMSTFNRINRKYR